MTGESEQELRRRNTMELHHQLFGLLRSKPWLLVLDGLERLLVAYQRLDSSDSSQDLSPDDAARETDEALLRNLTRDMPSKVLISSRLVPRPLLNTSGQ